MSSMNKNLYRFSVVFFIFAFCLLFAYGGGRKRKLPNAQDPSYQNQRNFMNTFFGQNNNNSAQNQNLDISQNTDILTLVNPQEENANEQPNPLEDFLQSEENNDENNVITPFLH